MALNICNILVYDSTARLGSSLLNGNVMHLGDFDQCISSERVPEHHGGGPSVKGRYCAASVYMHPTGPSTKWRELHSLIELVKSHEAMSNAHHDVSFFFQIMDAIYFSDNFLLFQNNLVLPTFSPVQVGFCIPESCTHRELEDSISDMLKSINITSGIDFRVRVNQHSCLSAEEYATDEWAYIAM
jgi:hypothetical protein